MNIDVFQFACVAILVVAYAALLWPAADRRGLCRDIAVLVVAAYAGEQSCISGYHFYAYAEGWWLKLGDVPVLIPLIWPMVILSAQSVIAALWPGLSPGRRALAIAAAVAVDASMMEIIAVAGGLWHWAEAGYYDVPLVGILGWGCFGYAAARWLDATELGDRRAWRWALPLVTTAATHLLLLALWWGGLRWVLRGDLGELAALGFVGLLTPAAVAVAWARVTRGAALPIALSLPRAVAAVLFFALLASLTDERTGWLWIHSGAVGALYVGATRWWGPKT